jgi:3-dehydroquinate dehydratase/shikimate dehydrogenase
MAIIEESYVKSKHYMITTERLILRKWQSSDLGPFAAMNQDPLVMEYFPATLSIEETQAFISRIKRHFIQHGFGLWAVELKDSKEFIGFVGLSIPTFEAHFTPCVEIGWRLGSKYWGKGFAVEAAQAVLDKAFNQYGLTDIVSFTSERNLRSIRVMEKLGMTHNPEEDFDHPKLPQDHLLARHVLYRIKKTGMRSLCFNIQIISSTFKRPFPN